MMCKNCKHAFCWYCLESLDVSWTLQTLLMFTRSWISPVKHDAAVILRTGDPQRRHYLFALTLTASIIRILQLSRGLNSKKRGIFCFFWGLIEPRWLKKS